MISRITIQQDSSEQNIVGTAQLENVGIICVCAYCNHHDSSLGTIELNFRDQKIYYACCNCKKMNEISFSDKNKQATPYPRTNVLR